MAMETTGHIAALEDEVKLLKSEVKSILEEIRTALLDRDNPFVTARSDMPVFQPVGRPGSTEESTAPSPPTGDPTTPPGPVPATADEGGSPPGSAPGPATGEQMNDASPPAPPTQPAAAPLSAKAQRRGNGDSAPEQPMPDEARPEPWSVSTIASLVAWIDESSSRLGAAHLQMILDLARFAGLLPSEAQDALLKVIKLATGRKDSSAPSVNDILLALRQLEAILGGDEADDLSLMRRRRVAGRNR